MAVQYHLAHSASVDGAGILAAGPWGCAAGSTWRALSTCMYPTTWSPLPDTAASVAAAQRLAAGGKIDATTGVQPDRVWLLSGDADDTVERPVVDALAAFYRHWVATDRLRYVTLPGAGHAMFTQDDPLANACATSEPPFINRCGTFDAAGELLAWLLGPLQPKVATPSGTLLAFDQTPWTAAAGAFGMAASGYAYVPDACRGGGCRLHIAFHGCRQDAEQIGERFAARAGYNGWADSNRLVVLYPQTTPRYGWAWDGWVPRWIYNPKACWDWWGYEDGDYLSSSAPQIRAVKAMADQLARRPQLRR
jgi:poly(3-hydroxybutyrate) depolymerase